MSRLNNDVSGVNAVLTTAAVSVATNVIMVITTMAVMLAMNWTLLLIAFALVPFFVVPTHRVGAVRRRISRQASEKQAELSAFMQETLNVAP